MAFTVAESTSRKRTEISATCCGRHECRTATLRIEMIMQTKHLFSLLVVLSVFAGVRAAEDIPQARRGSRGETGRIFKAQITPHWFHNDTRFWYRNELRAGAKEFILVDAEKGTRKPAFDHQKLAAA